MPGDATERVLDELNARRTQREAEAAAHEKTMRDSEPRLKALDLRIARAAIHSRDALPDLYAERKAIAAEWLKARSLPESWLTPAHDCEACGDTGFVSGRLCTCVRNEAARRMFTEAGLTSGSPSFEKFELGLFSDAAPTKQGCSLRQYMAFLREMGLSYCDKFPELQKPNMLFTGPTGSGKTFLLDCIAARVISRGYWVVRITAFGVNDVMAKALFDRADPDSLFDCDLLALDDLGSEPLLNKVTVNSLFNLLNERTVAGKPFIISTNLKQGEILQRYDERIFSRMTDARTTRIIEFEGEDLRRGK